MLILLTFVVYIGVLLLIARYTATSSDNSTFFRGNRRAPWYLVAFGMIGASISGVTLVSVPGMVNSIGMTYLETCVGFIIGYLLVAFVLLPLYYRLQVTTIYTVLQQRLGESAYKTGAWVFILSKMAGAAVRFFVVCLLLHRYVLAQLHIPFFVVAGTLVLLIWLYTRQGGIGTLIVSDSIQTAVLLIATAVIIFKVLGALDLSLGDAIHAIAVDRRAQWLVVDDVLSPQYVWKQVVAGAFIVVVMTGLDQDMMQKNLACRTLRDAQKDMCTYGVAFVPVNLLFLAMGILLSLLCEKEGLSLPAGDALLPSLAATGRLGQGVVIACTVAIVAAALSSADSALTALTTTYCVDIREKGDDETLRKRAHAVLAAAFAGIIIVVNACETTSVIDTIYVLCSYTYGPLLGLFAFALTVKRRVKRYAPPVLAVAAPLLCYVLSLVCARCWGYHVGYELLLLNGIITFVGLFLSSTKETKITG